jgi:LysR family cyn operon transcriptional activator
MNTRMRAIALTEPAPMRHAGILWRKGGSRSVAAEAFARLLLDDLSEPAMPAAKWGAARGSR